VLAGTTILYLFLGTIPIILQSTVSNLEWGPRYQLMQYPLASICAAVGIEHYRRGVSSRLKTQPLVGLAILLLFIAAEWEWRGIYEVHIAKQDLVAYSEVLHSAEEPIVTDVFWFPSSLASSFVQQEIYTLAKREDLHKWLDIVDSRHDSFIYASVEPLDTGSPELSSTRIALQNVQTVHGMTFSTFNITSDAEPPTSVWKELDGVVHPKSCTYPICDD
jgi:hypothetical protein